MFLLGVISILQVFLPGFLMTEYLGYRNICQRLIYSFVLSELVNFQLAFVLTGLGIYTRSTVFVVLILEVITLLWCYKNKFESKKLSANKDNISKNPVNLTNQKVILPENLIIKSIVWGLAIYYLIYYLIFIYGVTPGVFGHCDDLFNWNRWAVDWYYNRFPVRAWEYPQLAPANWSIMYKIIGTEKIQMFAVFTMSFFPIGIMLVYLEMASYLKNIAFVLAAALSGWIIGNLYPQFIGGGYIDIPVAMNTLMVLYSFAVIQKENSAGKKNANFIYAALFASAAPLTKQVGLYIMLFYVLFIFYKWVKKQISLTTLISLLLTILVLVAPWYAFKKIERMEGKDTSLVQLALKDIYGNESHLTRFLHSAKSLAFNITFTQITNSELRMFNALFIAVIIILALLKMHSKLNHLKIYNYISFAVWFPFFMLWSMFFCYDMRNLALAIPFLALNISISAMNFIYNLVDLFKSDRSIIRISGSFSHVQATASNILKKTVYSFYALYRKNRIFFEKQKKIIGFSSGVLAIVILMLINYKCDYNWLTKKHEDLMRNIGYPEVNRFLYNYRNVKGLNGKIITDYNHMPFLPELGGYHFRFCFSSYLLRSNSIKSVQDFIPQNVFRNTILNKENNINYILEPVYTEQCIVSYLNQLERQKKINLVWKNDFYTFYEITSKEL